MNSLILGEREVKYKIKKSKRAKYARIAVLADTEVVVTVPFWGRVNVERILVEKQEWILEVMEKFQGISLVKGNAEDYKKNKKKAVALVREKVEFFNHIYNFSYQKVCVRNQNGRWGSCSSRGNLNFNYRILFLPAPLVDYIIVHELCHLGQMNHSKKFWDLVGKALPDYKKKRKELRQRFKIG
jgi:hypothetical protein